MSRINTPTVQAVTFILFVFAVAIASFVPATAAELIQSGDPVNVQFTCRLPSGEIVDTTDAKVAADNRQRKSRVFVAKETYAAVPLRAGDNPQCTVDKADAFLPHREFEQEVTLKIAAALVGKPVNRRLRLELTSDDQTDLSDQERYVQVARMTKLPKQLQVARDRFELQFAPNPKVGGSVDLYPEFVGRITAVTDSSVTVRFAARSADAVPSAFGDAVVHEKEDYFVIEVQARQGDLVRTGPVLGKVSKVQETMLTLDFGHPFGGRTLHCDVMAEALTGTDLTTAGIASMCREDGATAQAESRQSPDSNNSAGKGAGPADSAAPENPDIVQQEDLVELDYVVSLKDGRVVATNMAAVYSDPNRKMIKDIVKPDSFAPLMIKAGEADGFPGLSANVLGMRVGQKRQVELAPGQAFEPHDPRLVSQYRKTRYIPKTVTISAKDYIERFGSFPVVGKAVAYNPYLMAEVEKIDNQKAWLSLRSSEKNFSEDYGSVQVEEEEDRFAIILKPALGAPFSLQNRRGRIIADDGIYFTVDYNHPLAGKALDLEVNLVSLRKPSQLRDLEIQWIEDYDTGLNIAQTQNKPAVLVLYADWCGYSTKLLEESMADPRIKLMKDNFIWIKVDSHKNAEFKSLFEQSSYPLIVVMKPSGETLKQLKGFQAAPILRQELQNLIRADKQIAMW